ncbi:UDP-N-acetylmuramoyl-L-alanine--D-glutamate ligase [Microterricola pindariensis]|uniref:UDP-N-acetylmuramoylalanine--D-glutamate ligase n=1 Tax=Microterricola pindariensis TaxID=478010 RepID=A0ABX5AWB3_9MICO|nr:UDP-N-acetylmuramoyl-L-alanine--D-glutamate ligase [Microterricola pindariensis]
MDLPRVSAPDFDSVSDRLDSLQSWNADWRGLRVAVLGLGVTGFAAADTLTELGADVLVLASAAADDRARLVEVIGARLLQGELDTVPAGLADFDAELLIASPGFHPDHVVLEWAAKRGIAVWGDIELAWRLRDKVPTPSGAPAPWILVTGTNGKTTTTQLTATFLAEGGLRVAPCGNIGVPVLDAIRDPQGWDALVVELSSYQLHHVRREGVGSLEPLASVCLNIADDHLDWHGSGGAYRAAKATVYANTLVACVYNKADPVTEAMVREADVADGARAIGFDLGAPGPSDFGIVDGILCDRAFLDDRHHSAIELSTLAELAERGLDSPHIVANILAASALARAAGVSVDAIHRALGHFQLDAHRIQLVAVSDGVRWIDDSKATNPHAALASLQSNDSVVWVVGGLLKGVDIDDLVRSQVQRLRAAVIIGVDRSALREAFARHAPELPVFEVDSTDTGEVMPNAVRFAASVAAPGDAVLLAPAAASMDQFADYAERGTLFAGAVREFLGGGADEQSASGH